MNNQQTELGSSSEAKTGNSTLALLFFVMGALHIYGMMRSRQSRTLLAKKKNIVSRPGISPYVKVSLVGTVMALLVETLIF